MTITTIDPSTGPPLEVYEETTAEQLDSLLDEARSTYREHSGMAASTTNTFRELTAVVGVAVLGSIVNGQLTVNLVRRLTAIGIPTAYQPLVVSAVTTGAYQSESKSATTKSPAITHSR
jgi:hypothetical protein